MPGKKAIQIDDIVLTYQGPLMYEAKVLETKMEDSELFLFIHYQGWKKKYDEWIAADKVLVDTPANRDRQARAKVEYLESKIKLSKKKATTVTGKKAAKGKAVVKTKPAKEKKTTPAPNKSKKRKKIEEAVEEQGGSGEDDEEEQDEEKETTPEGKAALAPLSITIPVGLKKQLVKDWEAITLVKSQKLVSLPRSPTVNQILDNYLDQVSTSDQTLVETQEIFNGLKMYFDRALGQILLYDNERAQHLALGKTHADKNMSEIYGAEHLLRLFVRLPHLMAHTSMTDSEKKLVEAKFGDFLKFLHKHQANWFLADYTLKNTFHPSSDDVQMKDQEPCEPAA